MAFRFYIDDQLVNQPANDKALTTTIKYDKQLGALLVTQDARLQWFKNNNVAVDETDAYTYLMSVLDESVCSECSLEVYDEVTEQETYLLYKGIIKIPSLEIDEQRFSLITSVQDNSFYSYINNNREVKVVLNADQGKNKNPITPINQYSLDLYNSNGCSYGSASGALFHAYDILDSIDLIVRAISDNKISVQSDFMDNLDPKPFLTKGQELINPYTLFPAADEPVYEISFKDIYDELSKIYNLNFYIDSTDINNPILRIENAQALYNGQVIYNFNESDIKNITTKINLDNYFASVDVGSTRTTDGILGLYTFNEGTSYFGWKRESFHPIGQCNTSSVLNLVNNWVLSNNVIQETALLSATEYIDDYFLIECSNIDTGLLTADAYQYEYFGDGGCYYNFGMNNIQKVYRHTNLFETSFGSFISLGVDGCRILQGDSAAQDITYTTAPASNPLFIPLAGITVPTEFVNETTEGAYDGGNNYNNVTFRYTIPVDGVYSFTNRLNFQIAGCISEEIFQVSNTIILYDQFGNQKDIQSEGGLYTNGILGIINTPYGQIHLGSNGEHTLDCNFAVKAVAGDYIKSQYGIYYDPNQAGYGANPRTLTMEYTSFLECNGTPESGISIEANTKLRKFIHEFEYSIPESDWRTIVSNVNGTYSFTKDGDTRKGWIYQMIHDHQTGSTVVKLITDNATITES